MATKQNLLAPIQILKSFVLNTNNLREVPIPKSQGHRESSLTLALRRLQLEGSCRSTQLKKNSYFAEKLPCLAYGISTKFCQVVLRSCAVVRLSWMVAFLTDLRHVFRSSLSSQQIHFDCCQFQSDV